MTQLEGTSLHLLLEASQKSPVSLVQSAVPQAHGASFSTKPSVLLQEAWRHRLEDFWQKSPVPLVQSTFPHLQVSLLATVPSVLAQLGPPHRELDHPYGFEVARGANSQYSFSEHILGLVSLHPSLPHIHWLELATVPSVLTHLGSFSHVSKNSLRV